MMLGIFIELILNSQFRIGQISPSATAHVQVDDGVNLPIVVHFVDGQPLEQLAFALENGFEGANEQGFSKATGTREKVLALKGTNPLVNLGRFIDVKKPAFSKI